MSYLWIKREIDVRPVEITPNAFQCPRDRPDFLLAQLGHCFGLVAGLKWGLQDGRQLSGREFLFGEELAPLDLNPFLSYLCHLSAKYDLHFAVDCPLNQNSFQLNNSFHQLIRFKTYSVGDSARKYSFNDNTSTSAPNDAKAET